MATLDLRSVAACAQVGGTPQGFGLFITANATDLGASYENLGTDPMSPWGASARQRWRSALALPQALQANTLRGALWETLTLQSDPIGDDRCKPLVPNARARRYEVYLGGQLADSKAFALADPESTPLIDLLKRQYRAIREASLAGLCRDRFGQIAPEHYRKVLGFWVRKYRIAYRAMQPADLPDEEPLTPETTITDNFNRTDADALGSSSEGWSWTEVSGDIDIVSNQAKNPTSAVSRARADSDLSSDDHYSQITLASVTDHAGPQCRFASAADTSYLFIAHPLGAFSALYKIEAGSFTALSTGNATVASGSVAKITADGSDIECFDDGVSMIGPVTDTAITGNTRCGIAAHGSTNQILDNFEAADLAAPPATTLRSRLSLLGVGV